MSEVEPERLLGSKTVTVSATLWETVGLMSHFLGGALIILGPIALLGPKHRFLWAFVFLVIAAWKEAIWDEKNETADERGSGFQDFAYYFFGVAAGLGAWEIKKLFTKNNSSSVGTGVLNAQTV